MPNEGNIAEALSAQGRKQESLDWFNRSLEHMRNAKSRLPRPCATFPKLATEYDFEPGDDTGAAGSFPEALADWEQALKLAPTEQHALLRLRRALCLAQSGKPEESVAEAVAVTADSAAAGGLLLEAARVFARAAAASSSHREEYATRSLDLLRTAEKNGCFDTEEKIKSLREDPHLDGLRTRRITWVGWNS